VTNVPNGSPEIAVAILFERLGNVVERLDKLDKKLDQHNAARTEVLADLEKRVQHVERSLDRARWFLAGIAAAGGALGGGIAAIVARALGA
jgi:hypothetical protein